jgi:hypothetical protein
LQDGRHDGTSLAFQEARVNRKIEGNLSTAKCRRTIWGVHPKYELRTLSLAEEPEDFLISRRHPAHKNGRLHKALAKLMTADSVDRADAAGICASAFAVSGRMLFTMPNNLSTHGGRG